jgi:hypothetical protein
MNTNLEITTVVEINTQKSEVKTTLLTTNKISISAVLFVIITKEPLYLTSQLL